jgi:hypothetical protein
MNKLFVWLQTLFGWCQTEQFAQQATNEHLHVFWKDILEDVRLTEQVVRFVESDLKGCLAQLSRLDHVSVFAWLIGVFKNIIF